jgi:putative membrane protein
VSGSLILGYINEAFMLSSAASLLVGWYRIRHKEVARHRRAMLTTATLATGFFVSYVVKSLVYGDTTFGGPRDLSTAYQVFLQVHVLLATLAAILGILTLRYALRSRFDRHRRVAPWTASMWLVAAGTGLVVFILLYVAFPPGADQNVVRTIVGAG